MFNYSSWSLYVIEFYPCYVNLRTEAIEETKPYVHESKTTRLKQEVAQEDWNASVGPAPVDQQEPLQKSELGQCEVCVLHCLASLHSCYSHTNMSRLEKRQIEKTKKQKVKPQNQKAESTD